VHSLTRPTRLCGVLDEVPGGETLHGFLELAAGQLPLSCLMLPLPSPEPERPSGAAAALMAEGCSGLDVLSQLAAALLCRLSQQLNMCKESMGKIQEN
jgi:hypothetical protein